MKNKVAISLALLVFATFTAAQESPKSSAGPKPGKADGRAIAAGQRNSDAEDPGE